MRDVTVVRAEAGQSELLEREHELDTLAGSLDSVRRDSRGRIVVLSGEAGVGKTALLRSFQARAGKTRFLSGGCDALFAPRPLGPLTAVAEAAGGPLAQALAADPAPHEVVSALVKELQRVGPTVFVLEDVHWADEATLDVLRLLARRIENVPALVVASCRADELDRKHPLRIVLGELASSGHVARVKLEPLSPTAVAQLAAPHGLDADELYRKTAGNPFFVVEVLAADSDEIPDTVRDAVFARAARLGSEAHAILEAVAIAPPRADLWLLEVLAGDGLDGLDECLASGILVGDSKAIVFRHELARLAVEQEVPPTRALELHRKALHALARPPGGEPDLARLSHHAEAAADGEAVLRYAPAAAGRAAALGAHREAVAQYTRALRFAERLPGAERADLHDLRARSCYWTDQYDEGIASLEAAVELRHREGDRPREGDMLVRLADLLWCPGRTGESARAARHAVMLLEELPPGRELASAYAMLAENCARDMRSTEAITWARRALEIADRLGEVGISAGALGTIGVCEDDPVTIEASRDAARGAGLDELVAVAGLRLALTSVEGRRYPEAKRYLRDGLAYCSERGFELYRLYLLAFRARFELGQGRWSEAAESAESVLRIPRTSTSPRILALVVLALVRARRGDPEVAPLLDEAWELAEPTGELPRLGPVAVARAEAAWLQGRPELIAQATDAAFELACRRRAAWFAGELAHWRRAAGIQDGERFAPEPYALEQAGEHEQAAELWDELGCPYESALALLAAGGEGPPRRALESFEALGARPAASIAARMLRERGARAVPRGPRAATRRNAAGLTPRELEVLDLLADGLRNADVAARLFVSEKTVDHHVSAILRKLEARSRGQAVAAARRRGLLA